MSDSVRWLVNVPDSFKADSVRWNRGNRPEFGFNLSSDIQACREAGGTIIFVTDWDSDAGFNRASPCDQLTDSYDAQRKFNRSNPFCEPERRWWKLPARVDLAEFAILEMFVPGLFLLIAVMAIIGCF